MTVPKITAGRDFRRTRPRGYIENYRPSLKTQALLAQVDDVLDEYRAYWPLSVRQIYYRLIGKGLMVKDKKNAARLLEHLVKARRGRRISFGAIRDDGVVTHTMMHYDDADHFMREMRDKATNYRRNALADQNVHIEVWCEAAGMLQQVSNISHRYSVRAYSTGGFDSLTAKKDIADRIVAIGKPATILHLGDRDKHGEDIFKSLMEDVTAFVEEDRISYDVDVMFFRVALTDEQVDRYGLPVEDDGYSCQLEAMKPNDIARHLEAWLQASLDKDQLAISREAEAQEREVLTRRLLEFHEAAPA